MSQTRIQEVSTSQQQFDDQIRDYRLGARRRYNLQQGIKKMKNVLHLGTYNTPTLEQQVDPEKTLQLSAIKRASMVPAEILYHARPDTVNHKVYMHWSEEAALVVNNQHDSTFIRPESYATLKKANMQFIHIGLMQVRIQVLHRLEAGTMALVVFRDCSWKGKRSTIARMEVDLTKGSQLVYVAPNIIKKFTDFYNNIQVSILTKGYDDYQNSEANLLITKGLIGRLSNTSNVGFAYTIDGVADYFITHGVQALKGMPLTTDDFQGTLWNIKPSRIVIPAQPTVADDRELADGSISMRFGAYKPAPVPALEASEEFDSDEIQMVNVLTTSVSDLLIKLMHRDAIIPQRITDGSVGYDLAACEDVIVSTTQPTLVRTGIAIEVPKGTYAQLYLKSGFALKTGLQISGGVIDPDYTGEIQILLNNNTRSSIPILKGTFVAQIILHHVAIPDVREVAQLTPTLRNSRGFGVLTAESSNLVTRVKFEEAAPQPQLNEDADDEEDADSLSDYLSYLSSRSFCREGGEKTIAAAAEEEEEGLYFCPSPARVTFADDPFNEDPTIATIREDGDSLPIYDESGDEDRDDDLIHELVALEAGFDGDLDYPQLRQLEECVVAASTAVSQYTPPADTTMNPPTYPPARTDGASTSFNSNQASYGGSTSFNPTQSSYSSGRTRFRSMDYSPNWQLPSAQQTTGAMFYMPLELEKFDDMFSRWESITKNVVSQHSFISGREKAEFIENLLGETEKLTWIQWRTAYNEEYETLIASADGREGTQNIISQLRTIFTLEDPFRGSTKVQEEAYRDLERISCKDVQSIIPFMNEYMRIAAKTGRLFISSELSEKFWMKLPGDLGKVIKEQFEKTHVGNTIGVHPRILFTYKYLQEECKKAALARSLKNLQFCSKIPIPGYYQGKEKKYGVRKSTTYKGKPHDSHVRIERRKHLVRSKKCKCFLCGAEGHFARECPSDKRNVKRIAIFEGMEIPEDCDIVSVQEGDEMSDSIFSVSEGEGGEGLQSLNPVIQHHLLYLRQEDGKYFLGGGGWRAAVQVTQQEHDCRHQWEYYVLNTGSCRFCRKEITRRWHAKCMHCSIITCGFCSQHYVQLEIPCQKEEVQIYNPHRLLYEQQEYIKFCEVEIEKWKNSAKAAEKVAEDKILAASIRNAVEVEELRKELATVKLERDRLELENRDLKRILEESEQVNVLICDGKEKLTAASLASKEKRNGLYNLTVQLEIPGSAPVTVNAILDTGATNCCINEEGLPKEILEENTFEVKLTGANSEMVARKKLKNGIMRIGDNQFRIPYTFAFPLRLGGGEQLIIGCNFIRAMNGGVRIEGDTVTFYKNVTTVKTQQQVPKLLALEELEMNEDEYIELQQSVSAIEPSNYFSNKLSQVLQELKQAGYIGDDPLKFWSKNQVTCELNIINPDLTIQDKPLKHVTPAMAETFRKHIDALLKLKVIRESKSRHRTTAFIVYSGTTVDPSTGKEQKGKERMVFNYKRLNDNTEKDQYSLPGINTILKKVGQSKIYSKFDLKSGFHQVAMAPQSIEWTAFLVPGGLYEWLVMPFGLKNAPAVFQRKMDHVFRGTEDFIAVYIDDILVFSETEDDHIKHLKIMLDICKRNGLVLSPTKMKIGTATVEFLGAVIGNRRIKLQEHIIKKVANFSDEELKTTKGLRSWLGILNYARAYIPNMGRILGPLYSKVSPHGEKRLNAEDWSLIRKVRATIQNLPDLEFPPEHSFIIIEADGCMDGWGGVCKWKKNKKDFRRDEKVCAYASGKFDPPKSTIDAELFAVMNSMDKFKIHYLDKKELLIRSDCQALISFYNKSSENKPSRVRWVAFHDFVTGLGIDVTFEHIDGKNNQLADSLSRLVTSLTRNDEVWQQQQQKKALVIIEEIMQSALTEKIRTEVANQISALLRTITKEKKK
nr:ORF3 protein [Dioscorea bacilliform RT virus]AYD60112.1 ORF3 protein [Dioscorea bacilliform RT virus]